MPARPDSFRKAFHTVGNDDLRRVPPYPGSSNPLDRFLACPCLLQAAFKCRLGCLATILARKLLKDQSGDDPPFCPVVCSGRTD